MTLPRQVSILGLGLMGGSIGLALRELEPGIRRIGWSRSASTRNAALASDVLDEVYETPAEAVCHSDLVILCGPICSIPKTLEECVSSLKPGARVTDVGSTKAWVMNQVQPILQGRPAAFVGSHPMCGSEQQGVTAAHADLYQGALVVLTGGVPEAHQDVSDFWKALGARPLSMDAEAHDRRAAQISHMPHLMAALIVDGALKSPDRDRDAMIAGGFRDTTRVAAGPADIWTDIFRTNRPAMLEALAEWNSRLKEVQTMMETEDWPKLEAWLDACRQSRRKVLP